MFESGIAAIDHFFISSSPKSLKNVFFYLIDTSSDAVFAVGSDRKTINSLAQSMDDSEEEMQVLENHYELIVDNFKKYKNGTIEPQSKEQLAGSLVAYHFLSPIMRRLKENTPGLFGYTFYILLYPLDEKFSKFGLRPAATPLNQRSDISDLLTIRRRILINDRNENMYTVQQHIYPLYPDIFGQETT